MNRIDEMDEKLRTFTTLLLEHNKQFNLTRITDEDEIMLKHFLDSLTCEPYISKNARVVDIGAGAGFPSIPLAIARPDCEFCLVDALRKRVGFLSVVIETLKLTNCVAIHARAEDLGKNHEYREQFDYALSRAVAKLNVLAEYSLPLVKIGGRMLAMKGKDISDELADATQTITALGGGGAEINLHTLPDSDITHSIVEINKKRATPSRFPRNQKQIGTATL